MKKICFSFCLLLSLSSPALIANDLFSHDDPLDGTFYGGVSLGKTAGDCRYGYTDEGAVDCEGNAWKLFGGYQFHPNFALEAGYYRLFSNDGTDIHTATNGTQTPVRVDVAGRGLAVAGVGNYAINPGLDIFGKAGLMAWEANARTNYVDPVNGELDGTDLLFGLGASHKLNDNWRVRGEIEHVGGDLDANMYSVGTTYSTL